MPLYRHLCMFSLNLKNCIWLVHYILLWPVFRIQMSEWIIALISSISFFRLLFSSFPFFRLLTSNNWSYFHLYFQTIAYSHLKQNQPIFQSLNRSTQLNNWYAAKQQYNWTGCTFILTVTFSFLTKMKYSDILTTVTSKSRGLLRH